MSDVGRVCSAKPLTFLQQNSRFWSGDCIQYVQKFDVKLLVNKQTRPRFHLVANIKKTKT